MLRRRSTDCERCSPTKGRAPTNTHVPPQNRLAGASAAASVTAIAGVIEVLLQQPLRAERRRAPDIRSGSIHGGISPHLKHPSLQDDRLHLSHRRHRRRDHRQDRRPARRSPSRPRRPSQGPHHRRLPTQARRRPKLPLLVLRRSLQMLQMSPEAPLAAAPSLPPSLRPSLALAPPPRPAPPSRLAAASRRPPPPRASPPPREAGQRGFGGGGASTGGGGPSRAARGREANPGHDSPSSRLPSRRRLAAVVAPRGPPPLRSSGVHPHR